jgi:site-specific DNA recombinase
MAVQAVAKQRRAVGIVRVSRVGGREGESFTSPEVQRERIEQECERQGLDLIAVHEELNVSGGKSLANREGLRAAVEVIEAGSAEVIIGAFFDRLFRNVITQHEVTERLDNAGGMVLAVDAGQIGGERASASQWFTGGMLGLMADYQRRSIRERVAGAQVRAIERGVPVSPRVPLGYTREKSSPLALDPQTAPIVEQVFRMRADGESIAAIRGTLAAAGISRSYRGVQVMLANRIYLGEVHFGKLHNLTAHEPIIDRELFARVQRAKVPRGPSPSSDRLLARLRVLRCGSCGSPLGPMTMPKQGDGYAIYRCPSTNDCAHHCTIAATIAEDVVSGAVRAALADAEGRASMADNARRARADLDRTQVDYETAGRTLADHMDEQFAVDRLAELRQVRDEAQAVVDQLGPQAARTVSAAKDWDKLSLGGRRELIRATVESAIVAPSGRGAERIAVRLVGEQ